MKGQARSPAALPALAAQKTLLIVGPLPPPMGGATLTVRALLDELARQSSVQARLVDTRFSLAYRRSRLLRAASLWRAVGILRDYARQVRHCDAVLVFGNNAFIAALVGPLAFLARRHGKPFFLKPIGGDLDLYLAGATRPVRAYLLRVLRSLAGLLPQTQLLGATLQQFGCLNTTYIPGLRPAMPAPPVRPGPAEHLRLIYLSQIKPEKGVFVLLDALRHIADTGGRSVRCDFYGPVYEDSQALFGRHLVSTPGVRYRGVAETGRAIELIAGYDALVLPTFFVSEGHPGVLIEAMQAGVPMISTRHRAIPELITDGENGLLVPVRDSAALAGAIRRLADDPDLLARLARANLQRGQSFQAEVVVPRLLRLIFRPSMDC